LPSRLYLYRLAMRLSSKEGDVGLRGHTLIVPGVGGTTHMGQLCTDAIVATFELHNVAIVHSLHVLPVVMASAWETVPHTNGHVPLTTAAELYQSATKPLLSVLQLRSPIIEGRRQAFAEELWCWACSEGVAELFILGSCSSHVKGDADFVAATDLRYVCVNPADRDSIVKTLGGEALPLGHSLEDNTAEHDGDIVAVQQLLRGSGIARSILLIASDSTQQRVVAGRNKEPSSELHTPSVLCLVGMTSEILNWHGMTQLARVACRCIESRSASGLATEFRIPPSWQFQMEVAASPQQLWG